MLPPSVAEEDLEEPRTIVRCTDEQQTHVTQAASKLVDVLVEAFKQGDSSSRTEHGMEVRGDESGVEAVSMELLDSFVAPDDSPMVPMQVDYQVSPKLCYIDSSMQSPEVTIDTVVGEFESVDGVASLSSNHSEQEAKVVVPESDQPLSDMEVVVLNKNSVQDKFEETSNATGSTEEPTCSTRIQSDASNFQNVEGDVNIMEEARRELDIGVEPVVYSVCQDKLEGTSQKCSVERDKEKSCGSDILEAVSFAMLVRRVEEDATVKAPLHKSSIQDEFENYSTAGNKDSESSRVELLGTNPVEIVFGKWMVDAHGRAEQLYGTLKRNSSLQVEKASAHALLLSSYEASVKLRTKACYADQPMNPRVGQNDASGPWMEEGCWIYFIQDANGRQWERSCRDFQIHHVQPD